MNKKLSTLQLVLMTLGGIIGCGWLFSPFYGFQLAGVGVIYSWCIAACIIIVIGTSFALMCNKFPIVGGIYRLTTITHNKRLSSVFLLLGWLSYLVYAPLEAQSVVQYLGYWIPHLTKYNNAQITLSWNGIGVAILIIMLITWFNTLIITKVAKANNWVSIWKIIIPLLVAIVLIIKFGKIQNFAYHMNAQPINLEHIFLAITSTGIAFAFSGFQNGLSLAHQVQSPKKALSYSLFIPVIVCVIIYICLSLIYILCLDGKCKSLVNATAPLLGIVSLFSVNWLFAILFVDAVVAPLGTTNVFIAVTSRVLYSVGRELHPNGPLTKLNNHNSPVVALWINAILGIVFLLPFPTWTELVSFLSSITVFAYLSGPITLMTLNHNKLFLKDNFNFLYEIIGILGFIFCGLLIYWSGLNNLLYLFIALIFVNGIYAFFVKTSAKDEQHHNTEISFYLIISTFIENWYLFGYVGGLWGVSYFNKHHLILFPYDNIIVACLGILFGYIFTKNCVNKNAIQQNINRLSIEIKTQ